MISAVEAVRALYKRMKRPKVEVLPPTVSITPGFPYVYRGVPSHALSDRAKLKTLRTHLDLLLHQIGYDEGTCSPTDQIQTLVRADYLESVRRAMEICNV